MDLNSYTYLKENPHLLQFVRYQPIWYRYITRDPTRIYQLEKEAKLFYGKTFSQRLGQMNEQLQMAHMLISFAEAMKD
ncbi:YlbE-like family protein [Virgibacillus sp. W0181]|uniref:YlbE-like family protein n=1 Tax=Virgibacillus sp. W0181 TaxID=3391581 RepID=UPI003F4542B4